MVKNLNVGCGRLHKKSSDDVEWINLDQFEEVNPDVVCDMTKGMPFKDGEINHIEAMACLGQIEKNSDFLFVMNEFWRVLRNDGTIFIYLPHKDRQICWHDPFNQRRTNEDHWWGFSKDNPQYIHHNSYYGFKPWHNVSVVTNDAGFLVINMTKYE
jgi:predicted SAM-dependent methyltransferase